MEANFLLTTPFARKLYHETAAHLPIIDYHNHLPIKEVSENKVYQDFAELWLLEDPYKHRAMRICGVEEAYITGETSHYEKFLAWSRTLPQLLGSPLYHWSVMELSFLGVSRTLNEESGPLIWQEVNEKLSTKGYGAKELLDRFAVEYSAPCTSLTDDLNSFIGCEHTSPSFRGDTTVAPTLQLLHTLEADTGVKITSLSSYLIAVSQKIDEFHRLGCRFADHALDSGFWYDEEDGDNETRFLKLLRQEQLDEPEQNKLTCAILRSLGGEYAKRDWVMQLHIGANRFTSTRLRKIAGPAGGYACIGECCSISAITRLLDDLEQSSGLPRTLLFPLNPADHEAMAALSGSYSKDGIRGLVQQGPAWWWCDHLSGIRNVLESVSSFGALSTFFGMTTDSRNILSFVRHDYFRRVLCQWLGEKRERGEFFQTDEPGLRQLVGEICYQNAKEIAIGGNIN